MAAWSEHEDGPWVETRSALGRNLRGLSTPLTPCPSCNHVMGDECPNCSSKRPLSEASNETLDMLVSHPLTAAEEKPRVQAEIDRRASEPFPTEVWTFFDDEALGQLVIDVMAEIGRRNAGWKS